MRHIVSCLLLGVFLAGSAYAQNVIVGPDREFREQTLSLPYAFYNEAFGAAVGYVQGKIGYPQKQAGILGTAMAGTQGAGMLFVMGRDIQLPLERLFLDPIFQIGYFSDLNVYTDGNPFYSDEQSGSNDSDEDNYIEGDGWDNFFRMRFKFLLPMGLGRDTIINTYVLDRGMLIDGQAGGLSWNPFKSGRTYLEIVPFYRSQDIDGDYLNTEQQTNGVDIALFHDNRDFSLNPSTGHALRVQLSRDFGWFNSSDSWTVLQAEYDHYLSLGATETFRQRVLALDVWTVDTLSWDNEADGTVSNRPPAYAGATLGGVWRMRAYPSQRFNDQAAIYYAAELRLMPEWNPFDNWPRFQEYAGIQWWQWVPFVEVGRVAPTWQLDELHSDMQWDVGFGIRAFAKGAVIRIDSAASEEGFGIQMMVAQPFQF